MTTPRSYNSSNNLSISDISLNDVSINNLSISDVSINDLLVNDVSISTTQPHLHSQLTDERAIGTSVNLVSATATQASSTHPQASSRVQILNSLFDALTTAEVVDWMTQLIQAGDRGYICTVNVAILMMMRSNPQLQQFVEQAALVVADGQPIVWASYLFNRVLPERVTGIDLIEAIAARSATAGFRIYFLGATPEIIRSTVQNYQARYPHLCICGFGDGYFSSAEVSDRVTAIRESGAQILFVGMGVPKQEAFLEENWEQLGVNVAIGVGGSFDVLSGKRKRAPLWVQEVGLEWLYRLIQEPRRLAKRYLTTNLQFIHALVIYSVSQFGEVQPVSHSGDSKRPHCDSRN